MFHLSLPELMKSLVYQVSWSLFSTSGPEFLTIEVLVLIWAVLIRQDFVYLLTNAIGLIFDRVLRFACENRNSFISAL